VNPKLRTHGRFLAWEAPALSVALFAKALLVTALLAACADDAETEPDEPEPEPSAAEAIYPANFESDFVEVRDCRLSPAEHDGYYIRVLAPEDIAPAYVAGEYPFPEGALLVKAEYDDEECSTLARVSAMLKLAEGDALDLFDWQWQRTDQDGEVLTETPARSCAGCHATCEASDYACTEP
jgi:hypothetical protein